MFKYDIGDVVYFSHTVEDEIISRQADEDQNRYLLVSKLGAFHIWDEKELDHYARRGHIKRGTIALKRQLIRNLINEE